MKRSRPSLGRLRCGVIRQICPGMPQVASGVLTDAASDAALEVASMGRRKDSHSGKLVARCRVGAAQEEPKPARAGQALIAEQSRVPSSQRAVPAYGASTRIPLFRSCDNVVSPCADIWGQSSRQTANSVGGDKAPRRSRVPTKNIRPGNQGLSGPIRPPS